MTDISFSPTLPTAKSKGLDAGHLGRAVKVWAKIEGVRVGILATGGGTGIEWMFSERLAADGAAFVLGFGVRLLDCDWHDWNHDPFARGAWVADILGQPEAHSSSTWSSAGTLAFASSDFAAVEAVWFEAAIVSGAAAAEEIIRILAHV